MVECNTVKVSLTPSPTEAKSDPEQLHHEAGPTLHESCESDGKGGLRVSLTPSGSSQLIGDWERRIIHEYHDRDGC